MLGWSLPAPNNDDDNNKLAGLFKTCEVQKWKCVHSTNRPVSGFRWSEPPSRSWYTLFLDLETILNTKSCSCTVRTELELVLSELHSRAHRLSCRRGRWWCMPTIILLHMLHTIKFLCPAARKHWLWIPFSLVLNTAMDIITFNGTLPSHRPTSLMWPEQWELMTGNGHQHG